MSEEETKTQTAPEAPKAEEAVSKEDIEAVNKQIEAKDSAKIEDVKGELASQFEQKLEAQATTIKQYTDTINTLQEELKSSKEALTENSKNIDDFRQELEELKPRKGLVNDNGNPYQAQAQQEQAETKPVEQLSNKELIANINNLDRATDLEIGQSFLENIKKN